MHFERAAAILRGVESAPSLGVAAPVPSDDLVAAGAHRGHPQSRIRAARSWLFALGYLAEDTDGAEYDPALEAAVARFQDEAGLAVDGWIGARQTWPRLQELVTFEKPLEPDDWVLPSGRPRPALVRAAGLRLSVYGIDGARPVPRRTPRAADLTAGLQAFHSALSHLGAALLPPDPRFAGDLAAVLDHDAILARVVAAGNRRPVRRLLEEFGRHNRDDAAAAFGLLLNLAKVELWLAQEAEVGLATAYRGRLRFGRELVLPGDIRRDMEAYMAWMDDEIAGVSGLRDAFRRALRAKAPYEAVRLFLRAASDHGQVAEPFAEDRLALLDRFYGGTGDAVPRRAAETVRALTGESSFRSRLWDGLRRLWSWMKTALARAIATGRHVLKLAREVAAYAFRAASEGLRQVLRAIGAFARHADTALNRAHVDPRGWVGVRREVGRDVNLVVSPNAPPGYVAAWTEQVALSASIFRRASTVVRFVIALGLSVSGLAVGGPLVLRSLLQVVRDLRHVVSVLGEIGRLQARHDALGEQLRNA